MRIGFISPVLASALSACAAAPVASPVLKIERAIYSVEDGSIPCEVTSRVASICRGLSECNVPVDSKLCPMGDPAPTEQKVLTVTYTCGQSGQAKTGVMATKNLALSCTK